MRCNFGAPLVVSRQKLQGWHLRQVSESAPVLGRVEDSMKDPVGPKKIDGIQQLRALAMLAVIFVHRDLMNAGVFFHMGHAAVYLFFVISGFVMTKVITENFSSIRNKGLFFSDLRVYIIRRFWRIYPVAAVFFLLQSTAWEVGLARTQPGYLALLFVSAATDIYQTLRMIHLKDEYIDYGLWTIAGEEKLYFVLPIVLIQLFSKYLVQICSLLVSVVVVIVFSVYGPGAYYMLYFNIGVFSGYFCLGSIVYQLAKRVSSNSLWNRWPFLNLPLFVLLIAMRGLPVPHIWYLLMELAAAGFLVFRAALGSNLAPRGKISEILLYFGNRSYSFYLLNLVIYVLSDVMLATLGVPAHLVPGLSVLVLCAVVEVVYRLIELPAISYSKRFEYTGSSSLALSPHQPSVTGFIG